MRCSFTSLQVAAMNEFAERLCAESHYESLEVKTRRRAVLDRRSKVKLGAVDRKNKLEDCRKLTVFLQNIMEVSRFVTRTVTTYTQSA